MKNRSFLILSIFLIFTSFGTFSDPDSQKGQKLTLAVIGKNANATSTIESYLLTADYLQLVERNSVEKLYTEMKLGQQGLIESSAYPEVGKFLSAFYLVIVDDKKSFRLVHTQSSRVLGSWSEMNPENLKNLLSVLEIQSCLMELVNAQNPDANNEDVKIHKLFSAASQKGAFFGENISFEILVRSNKLPKVYLTVLAYFSDGQLLQLFPNEQDPNNLIEVKKTFIFPPPKAKYKIVAGPPAGIDKVVFIASEKPVGLPAQTPKVGGLYPGLSDGKLAVTKGLTIQLKRLEEGLFDVQSLELEIKP